MTRRSEAEGPLAIAQVTPYRWEEQREVNVFVDQVASGLAERGHAVLVVAPSDSRALVRESRRRIRAAAAGAASLLAPGEVTVLAAGQSIPFPPARRGGTVSLPIDVARTIEQLLATAPLDVVHVHEPFAPSASAAALRYSRALNIGTFHAPTERVMSTQVARRLVELLFGRLDVRTATFDVTRNLVGRYFPDEYEFLGPGVDLGVYAPGERAGSGAAQGGPAGDGAVEIAFAALEERAALRFFLRALRRLPAELPWRATVWSPRAAELAPRIGRRLRERVRFTGPSEIPLAELLGRAEVVCAASGGAAPQPQLLLKAVAAGAVPVASRIQLYEETLRDGQDGLLFEPGDPVLLTAQLARIVEHADLRQTLRKSCLDRRPELAWDRVAGRVEEICRRLVARRHRPEVNPAVERRLAKRPFVFCDLHMHTDHSPDCATPVDVLLETAKARGLGAIAVTDHNEISGALEAAERANGIKVIVAEEIKTASQGEVIGLFIQEKIPRGLSLEETIAAIKAQGGLVYVPHPFDRLHAVPDYEHLLGVVDQIDILEVFNARVAVPSFNEEAERFAAKYRIVAGAGSDSHVPQGLGSVKIRMRDFDGPEEFLESLREADILRKRKSLIYLQSLKFLQTKARPAPARRAAKARGKRAR